MSSTSSPSPVLQRPGTQYEPSHSRTVERYQLHFSPKSGTEINHERLPSQAAMGGMELAYREQQFSDGAIGRFAQERLRVVLLWTLAGALAVVLSGPFLPLVWRLGALGGVSFLASGFFALKRRLNLKNVVGSLFVPPVLLAASAGLNALAGHRAITTIILASATLLVFRGFGGEPFEFYRQWLYTHPRLKPETRRAPQRVTTRPDLVLLAIVLAIAVLVPAFSNTLALLTIAATCAFLCHRSGGIPRLLALSLRPFGQYLACGRSTSGAPGVWQPTVDMRWRQRWIVLQAGALYLTLAVGLCVFAPWDLLAQRLYAGAGGATAPGDPGHAAAVSLYASEVAGTPHGWIFQALPQIFDPSVAGMFVVALAIALALPNLVMLAVYRRAIVGTESLRRWIEGGTDRTGRSVPGVDDDGRPEWQWYVDRLSASRHEAPAPLGGMLHEAEHLFLGVEPHGQFPVLLDRAVLSEHAYIVGQTGSGKTSLGIMPLLIQLLRGPAPESGKAGPPPPLVVLDLKGDPALFHTIRAEAARNRRQLGIDDTTPAGKRDPRCAFRFFTPEPNKLSHRFDPFASLQTKSRSMIQVCQLFMDALALNHGEGYGRSYYSRRTRHVLFETLTDAPTPTSFEELYDKLKMISKDERGEALELMSTIHALTQYPMLQATKSAKHPERGIHMPSVLQHRQVVYFWLPSAIESVSVREIGKLALYALLSAAIERQQQGQEARQCYVVIDEFQRIAGENFKVILEQARSFGVGAILANQSQSDLRLHEVDLRPTIHTNTRFKQFFSLGDPEEVQQLSRMSGEELAVSKGWGSSQSRTWGDSVSTTLGTSSSWSEILKPRLTVNDIIRVSDHPLDSLVLVNRGSGYTQFGGVPVPVRSVWPLEQSTYRERQRLPWPEANDDGIDPDETGMSDTSPRRIDANHDERVRRLAAQRVLDVFERDEHRQGNHTEPDNGAVRIDLELDARRRHTAAEAITELFNRGGGDAE